LELITGASNISLSIFGYGHLTGQFTVYYFHVVVFIVYILFNLEPSYCA
jgi:hypothetical protein